MKSPTVISILLLACIATTSVASAENSRCASAEGVTLQVLGTGGPIADDGRASTAYLVWIDGRSRFLIDAGGGAFLRFGEAGAKFTELAHIGISHFHTDHSADLVALLKSGYFSSRQRSLSISGPTKGNGYPAMDTYLERLVGADQGAYAYLAGYLDGSDGLVQLAAVTVDTTAGTASRVYIDPDSDIEITAIGVPHGPVPTLAYRIRVGQKSIVFSGDQNGSSDAFVDFARGTDLLVMHMPVPEGVTGVGRTLHAPPGVIADIANHAAATKLVLSHFMKRSLDDFEGNLGVIRKKYTGPLQVAQDLDCINV